MEPRPSLKNVPVLIGVEIMPGTKPTLESLYQRFVYDMEGPQARFRETTEEKWDFWMALWFDLDRHPRRTQAKAIVEGYKAQIIEKFNRGDKPILEE